MAEENLQLTELQKKADSIQASLVEMTKRADEAERELQVAKLADDDKLAYSALSKAEQDEYHLCKDDRCREGVLAKGRDAVEKANAVPAHIQKRMEAIEKQLETERSQRLIAEAAIAKAQNETALAKFGKQADTELPNLPGTSEEKGGVLKALYEKLTEEEVGKVMTWLRAGNASHSVILKPVGKGGVEAGNSAWEKIQAKAKELVGKSGGVALTEAQAIDKVLQDPENAKLYTEYLQEGARQ